jgi:lysozyme
MINGIDVSHYDEFNWDAIRPLVLPCNLYFSFAKASEGVGHPDRLYDRHRSGAAMTGLLHGAFHFFLPTEDIAAQVRAFANQAGALRAGDLPPTVDIEWCKVEKNGRILRPELWDRLTPVRRIEVSLAILREVEDRFGRRPMVYTHPTFWADYILSNNRPASYAPFADYPLWLVDLRGGAKVPRPWRAAAFVQVHFGESAPDGAPLFERLDQDHYDGDLKGLLSLTTTGLVFDKDHTPVCSIIRDLQQTLKNRGFYTDTPDGDFGPNTERAARDFQQSVGLSATGVIDEPTWRALL